MTRAPAATPSCTAADPMPPAPACTSNHSPAANLPRSNSVNQARWNGKKKAAASTSSRESGTRNVMSGSTIAYSACPPNAPTAHAITRSPIHRSSPGPVGVDHADDLHAERVRQRWVHREVTAFAAVDLVLVQHRGVHPHPQLPGSGLGAIDVGQGQRVERRPVALHLPSAHPAPPFLRRGETLNPGIPVTSLTTGGPPCLQRAHLRT